MSKVEPAFPISVSNDPEDYVAYPGLTKREYAAIQIAAGMLARTRWDGTEVVAEIAVEHADALLRALERKPE